MKKNRRKNNPMNNPKNSRPQVVAYLRSFSDQCVPNTIQMYHIASFLHAHGYELAALFEDSMSGAESDDVGSLCRMLDYIAENRPNWQYLVIYDASRISTDFEVFSKFVDVLHKFGIIVVTLDSRVERQWETKGEVLITKWSENT